MQFSSAENWGEKIPLGNIRLSEFFYGKKFPMGGGHLVTTIITINFENNHYKPRIISVKGVF